MKINNTFLIMTTTIISLIFFSGCMIESHTPDSTLTGSVELEDNSKVCVDRNLNKQCDEGEPTSLIINKSFSLKTNETDNGLELIYETPSGQIIDPYGTVLVTLVSYATFKDTIYDRGIVYTNANSYKELDDGYIKIFLREEGNYLVSLKNTKSNKYYQEGEIEITETSGYKYTIEPNTIIKMNDDIEIRLNINSLNDTWDIPMNIKDNNYTAYSVPILQLIQQ